MVEFPTKGNRHDWRSLASRIIVTISDAVLLKLPGLLISCSPNQTEIFYLVDEEGTTTKYRIMAGMPLGPIDELPQLRTYTILLLGFPLEDAVDQAEVMHRLQSATDTLVDKFPFLAGYTTIREADEEKVNATKHMSGKDANKVTVTHNNISELFPSYQTYKTANAPTSMLDGRMVAEGEGFPAKSTGSILDPCLRIRANFVSGGLLLTFSLIHNVGDGNSLGQLIKMFAIACRGDNISKADVEAGNVDRQGSIPSLRPHELQSDHSNMLVKGAGASDHATADGHMDQDTVNPICWAYFHISRDKLAELKAEASPNVSKDSDYLTVSTNDAFTALIWRAITTARLQRLEPDGKTMLMRAINSRRKLDPPLPAETIQNVITATYTVFNLRDVPTLPLRTLASQLRKDLHGIDDHHVRSVMTFIRSTKDKNSIGFGASCTPKDVVVSSFANFPVYGDYGSLLGKPEFARRPTLLPADGLVYIMPRNPDGSLEATISIREDDMERMRTDDKWNHYTEYIG